MNAAGIGPDVSPGWNGRWPALLGALLLLACGEQTPAAAAVTVLGSEPCDDATCYSLAVECQGLPARTAIVSQHAAATARGAVLLTTGGGGRARYDRQPIKRRTREVLLGAGFEVFQIAWQDENGWVGDARGAGFEKILCVYPEVVRWIATEKAANPDLICAQGNSGGALQNAYGLAAYGLEDLLDMVVLSGGPPISRIDDFCHPENADRLRERMIEQSNPGASSRGGARERVGRSRSPEEMRQRERNLAERARRTAGSRRANDAISSEMVTSTGRTISDVVMGWDGNGDYCKRLEPLPEAELARALGGSLVPPPSAGADRDFDYPSTKLNFVGSEIDGHFTGQGRVFHDAVRSEKAWYALPGGLPHSIDNTDEGAAKIRELFLTECRPR